MIDLNHRGCHCVTVTSRDTADGTTDQPEVFEPLAMLNLGCFPLVSDFCGLHLEPSIPVFTLLQNMIASEFIISNSSAVNSE